MDSDSGSTTAGKPCGSSVVSIYGGRPVPRASHGELMAPTQARIYSQDLEHSPAHGRRLLENAQLSRNPGRVGPLFKIISACSVFPAGLQRRAVFVGRPRMDTLAKYCVARRDYAHENLGLMGYLDRPVWQPRTTHLSTGNTLPRRQ